MNQKVELYGHTKEHTENIRARINAIPLDPYISNEKAKMTTEVNEISNGSTKSPTTAIGETEKKFAA